MFDWNLFLTLVAVCLPGLLVAIPRTHQGLLQLVTAKLAPEKSQPSRSTMLMASFLQSLVLVMLAAAVGVALASQVGLSAPFFEAVAHGQPLWPAAQPQIVPALLTGTIGALVIVVVYYHVFNPRFEPQTRSAWDGLRLQLGVASRLLYGGIVEEVLFRWGVLTLAVWLAVQIFGGPAPLLMWGMIIVTGVLFGLGHWPVYTAAGVRVTPLVLTAMISINLWATLICGWLFWQYGLLAAMLAHMLFHLVWRPFDLHYARRAEHAANLPMSATPIEARVAIEVDPRDATRAADILQVVVGKEQIDRADNVFIVRGLKPAAIPDTLTRLVASGVHVYRMAPIETSRQES